VGADALLKGNLREALAHAQRSIELDESNADAHMLAGTVYLGFCSYSPQECRLSEAERHIRKAINVRKNFREATNTLGSILIHQHRYEEAIAVLKPLSGDILYATPENVWGNLGWAYLEKGDMDNAIEALRRAVASQPSFCWGNAKLALAYERKGDLKAALDSISAAVTTSRQECKTFADAYELRARILQKLGEHENARADLERCKQVGAGSSVGKRCSMSLGQSP